MKAVRIPKTNSTHTTPLIMTRVEQEVTAVFVREIDHINYLTIVDETGNEQVIEVTDGHPFWVVTDDPDFSRAASNDSDGLYHGDLEPGLNGYWVEARDLREGDVFIGANGELSTFVSSKRVEFPDGITVYNFTVDGNHDYFVIAQTDEFGQTCVLVHNQVPAQAWQIILKGLARAGIAAASDGPVPVGDLVAGGLLVGTVWELIQFARKHDIEEIDYIADKYGMNNDQRRELHEEMKKIKSKGDTLTREEIEEIAQDIMRRYHSKPRR
jgi:hypothetical protein